MSTNAILPPVIHMEESDELESFFAKDKKTCKDNPHCRCGRYKWCAGSRIDSAKDWRMQSLSVAEQTSIQYKTLQSQDKSTIPVPK